VFSSPDGLTGWEYHGIVVPRGLPGRGAGPSSTADIHLNVLNHSYDRVYLCARSAEIGMQRQCRPRPGPTPGGWDSGGIASPGAAAFADGTVAVGYAAENSPSGGRNRGIGLALAGHPLGPFVKQAALAVGESVIA
jgi:hypothetical protein